MDIASLSLPLSMQSPIDREICRCRITDIVPFLCLHCFTDGHSPSLSVLLSISFSLSMQAPSDREIFGCHIMEIVPYLCFHHLQMDITPLSLSLGKYADLV